jgi:hypothetical protein
MTAITRFERPMVAIAIGLPCMTSLVLMFWAPGAINPTTYAVVASLLVAMAAIVINTWKSAQGTGSLGQLLYETERIVVVPASAGAQTRWDKWSRRYDRSAARGHGQALLVLSVAVTALIGWSWLTSVA